MVVEHLPINFKIDTHLSKIASSQMKDQSLCSQIVDSASGQAKKWYEFCSNLKLQILDHKLISSIYSSFI